MTRSKDINVFVHLGHGFGIDRWRDRYDRGLIPGLNEPQPYGYYRAGGDGFLIDYSQDAGESRLVEFMRRTFCRTLGFDLIHAWRNRKGLLSADIVWTHTEREHLAAMLLFRLLPPHRRPFIIAQCVWLFDRWPRFFSLRRRLFLWLLAQASIVTTLSPENLKIARHLLPWSRTELVMFGIKSDCFKAPRASPCHQPLRIAALGSDMHRDWKTLLRAFAGQTDIEVRIASRSFRPPSTAPFRNVKVQAAATQKDIQQLYGWADIVVVPLKPNAHVSGISVILEATISGLPVIATATGGLRAYFSTEQISYVPAADPIALRKVTRDLARDGPRRLRLATAAQRRIIEAGLTSESYALRHRNLSQELLLGAPPRCQPFFTGPEYGVDPGHAFTRPG